MDEQTTEKTEEKKPEESTGDTKEGDKPKTTPLIDIANAAAERMEKANEKTERLLDRQEEMDARRALGGRAEAGQAPAVEKDETPEEYKERIDKEIQEGKHDD